MPEYVRVCPTCQALNEPLSLYCKGCHTFLAGIEPTDQAAAAPTPASPAMSTGGITTSASPLNDRPLVICHSCAASQPPDPSGLCERCAAPIEVQPAGTLPELPSQPAFQLILPWGTAMTLDVPELVIGRQSGPRWLQDALVANGFTTISRRHARIFRQVDGSLQIEDLRSTNGTFLDGQRLTHGQPAQLASGSEIRLGSSLLLRIREPSSALLGG